MPRPEIRDFANCEVYLSKGYVQNAKRPFQIRDMQPIGERDSRHLTNFVRWSTKWTNFNFFTSYVFVRYAVAPLGKLGGLAQNLLYVLR